MKKFEKVLKEVLEIEKGVSDHPDDRGGLTYQGVTTRTYNEAVLEGVVEHNDKGVRGLTQEEVKTIYYKMFWKPLNLDSVADIRIGGEIFDTGVNVGIKKAAKITQRALQALGEDLVRDGYIGPNTLAAVNKWGEAAPEMFLILLNILQGGYYVEITERDPNQRVFLKGWINKRIQVQLLVEEEEKDGIEKKRKRQTRQKRGGKVVATEG